MLSRTEICWKLTCHCELRIQFKIPDGELEDQQLEAEETSRNLRQRDRSGLRELIRCIVHQPICTEREVSLENTPGEWQEIYLSDVDFLTSPPPQAAGSPSEILN